VAFQQLDSLPTWKGKGGQVSLQVRFGCAAAKSQHLPTSFHRLDEYSRSQTVVIE